MDKRAQSYCTTAEVDGSDQLQVRVDPPDTVDVSTVLQTGPHRRLVQVPGFALQPEEKQSGDSVKLWMRWWGGG